MHRPVHLVVCQRAGAKGRIFSDQRRPIGIEKVQARAVEMQRINAQDQANKAASQQGQRTDLVDNDQTNINEVESRPTGTSTAAALRRLRKDRPDIHARVLAGALSQRFIDAGKFPHMEILLSSAFHLSKRLDNLTFTHHRFAMSAPPERRFAWLARAEQWLLASSVPTDGDVPRVRAIFWGTGSR
jgi:hypothetical protein